jgi:hypothetical protein
MLIFININAFFGKPESTTKTVNHRVHRGILCVLIPLEKEGETRALAMSAQRRKNDLMFF